jgi:hypothetical protein
MHIDREEEDFEGIFLRDSLVVESIMRRKHKGG